MHKNATNIFIIGTTIYIQKRPQSVKPTAQFYSCRPCLHASENFYRSPSASNITILLPFTEPWKLVTRLFSGGGCGYCPRRLYLSVWQYSIRYIFINLGADRPPPGPEPPWT